MNGFAVGPEWSYQLPTGAPDARQAHGIFTQLGVTHILVGPHERAELIKYWQPLQGLEKFARSERFNLFFSNDQVRIYHVER